MTQARKRALVPALLFVISLAASAADDLVIKAKQQLDGGDAQGAYNLLIPLESERAGDPDFDYVLGSAALALGRNTEAVFALERVLAVQPNSAPAREAIARAYFNLKETDAAKREFENVQKQDVPPEIADRIDRFMDAISRIEESQRTTIRGFVEIGIGFDTNVNSATSDSQVAVPAAGGLIFTLDPSAQKQEDAFVTFGGGVNFIHPFSKRLSLFGGLAYQNKSNVNETDFSTYYYDANLGLAYRRDRDTFTLAGSFNAFFVDNPRLYRDSYRNATGLTAQWQHDFDSRNQVSVFGQYSFLEYPGQEIRNADRYVAGAGYAHAFGRGALITYVGLYGGAEAEKEEGVPQFGHELYGARLGMQWNVVEKFALFLNASGEHRKYGGPDPSFNVDREDDQYNASAGMIFVPKKGLRLTPQVSWTDNGSNISIYEFDRLVYQVLLRYDM
ncbi:MAG TPA: surface lipoprotein assembly modifier [Burkholderiales bacterium]|jgi:tetratricopeptide (TPR) repeat protein|nr:surface lipoprotein assembly modifier [Burkholderiales bacterium]